MDPIRYSAAACQVNQPNPEKREDIRKNTDRMIEMVDMAIGGYEPFLPVKLLAFPEFAHGAPVYDNVPELLSKLAVPIPNEHTDRYHRKATEYDVYIQTGTFLETDPRWPDVVFNTTCLVGPEGIIYKYRKVYPWIPWEVHSSPHDIPGYSEEIFPVAETELGKIAVATCYDWLFPETIREMTFRGAEIMIRISAYMDPWGSSEPMNWWTLVNRTRALENMTYVVASNQGAEMSNYPPFSWPGGSMIVDYDGRILAQADPGPGEKVVVAPINIQVLRNERERRLGHDTITHSRSSLYTYLASERLKPAREDINIKSLKDRIRNAKQKGSQ